MIVLEGSCVGTNFVVSAGTVVRGNVPERSIVYNRKQLDIKIGNE